MVSKQRLAIIGRDLSLAFHIVASERVHDNVIYACFACKFLPLKYDFLLGPDNRVSRHTQWLVGNELEAVKPFSFRNLETLKVKILPK